MSNHQRIIKNKVGLSKLSEMLGSVSDRVSAIAAFCAIPSVFSHQRLRSCIGRHLLSAVNSSSYAGACF
jgi:hypothetical protein